MLYAGSAREVCILWAGSPTSRPRLTPGSVSRIHTSRPPIRVPRPVESQSKEIGCRRILQNLRDQNLHKIRRIRILGNPRSQNSRESTKSNLGNVSDIRIRRRRRNQNSTKSETSEFSKKIHELRILRSRRNRPGKCTCCMQDVSGKLGFLPTKCTLPGHFPGTSCIQHVHFPEFPF